MDVNEKSRPSAWLGYRVRAVERQESREEGKRHTQKKTFDAMSRNLDVLCR